MNIFVLIKQVVDVELNIRVKEGEIIEEGLNYVISNWDEIALESALQIVEAVGDGHITVISVGPKRVKDALRRGLAMGADKAIHVLDDAFDGSDSFAYAKAFTEMLKGQDFDLILGGKQAQDTDAGLTMPMIAEFLDLPQVTNVSKLDSLEADKITVHRRGDNGVEVVDLTLPAVLTVNDSLNEPRLATLRGLMLAKKKPIETVNLSDIGVDPGLVGKAGRQTTVMRLLQPKIRKGGEVFEGEEVETAKQVVTLLAENEIGKESLFN